MEHGRQKNHSNNDSSTWRCSVCMTVNNGNFCYICGAPRPDTERKQICPKCGFQNVADARFCSQCSKKLRGTRWDSFIEFLKNNWKIILIGALLAAILAAFLLKPHEHTWEEATCTIPRTCKSCGETSGVPVGHEWEKATCTTPKTCKVCHATDGMALGHKWKDATYEEPQTCMVCGAIGEGVKQRPKGYVGDLLGYKEKVTLRDGYSTLNVHALVLFDKVERCKELTINMSVEMKAGTSCTDWQLWGRNGGKFSKIGSVYLPGGDGDTSQTVYFGNPVTFDAIVVTPTKPGGYSWALGFTVTDVWVNE